MSEDDVLQLITDNLELEVSTESVYTGGDPLYEDRVTITLLLNRNVISEVSV